MGENRSGGYYSGRHSHADIYAMCLPCFKRKLEDTEATKKEEE